KSPLPAVASRVCPHPCERDVNSLGYRQSQIRAERYPELVHDFPQPSNSQAISISAIERFLGDYGIVNVSGADFAPREEKKCRVAVIGAGPAGLSCAWHLRRQGYGVTIFDANEHPGGMLRYGIPGFRLPRNILDAEIDRFSQIGIQFRTCFRIDDHISCRILRDEYDAVVVATGEGTPKQLALKGHDIVTDGLWDGLTFLHHFNSNSLTFANGHVAVIGGGNTAIDCARSALRLGSSATIYYRRERKDMPAYAAEIADAEKEGVRFEFQVAPKQLLSHDGKVTGLALIQTTPDTVHHLSQMKNDELHVAVSQVVLAIGEVADLKFLAGSSVEGAHENGINVNFMGLTPEDGLFGCGDAAFGHGTVTQSIATGKRTAESVSAYLKQLDAPKAP
ncbi:MAG: FAD-dependent oxidoreductase, partial [Deltaproteobacteria bacterium]|nr:FAD-dependent oxidoreductase [Deltaproteobacteria bacterium]